MADKKTACMYGADCYRKNPQHLEEYSHPERKTEEAEEEVQNGSEAKRPNSDNGNGHDTKRARDESQQPSRMLMDPYAAGEERASKAEYTQWLSDPALFIKQVFFVTMPADFYSFWEFCKTLVKPERGPETAFESFGLKLVGPFDVLAGKFKDLQRFEPIEYLTHWRFYYDPPEFQTILAKEKSCIHYGYWRDDATVESSECLIARNDADKGYEMEMVAANIFQAVLHFLEKDFVATPFNKAQVNKVKKQLEDWATEKGFSLTNKDEKITEREDKIVCRTFHRLGIVAEVDRKTKVGYRPLQLSDANLKKMLENFKTIDKEDKESFNLAMDALQPCITAAYIAVDESDFATSLELGIDLFCFGLEILQEVAKPLLIAGYTMLQRPQYIAIAKTHLQNRRKGYDLDLLKKD
ncbi:histone PARylation factor 1-like [Culicoides brevitarsis]|uniref:histone PARylation factor 1-like n=1 Tax=Culicoides brevitarsis TaxID=469753 RepID=UPI00307CBDD8